MSALSTTIKTKLIDHLNGGTTYTKPTSVKLALYTDNPTAEDTGTEVTGGSYARQTLTMAAAASGSSSNSATVTFSSLPDLTSTPVTHVGIHDGTSGELIWYGPLAASRAPSTGGTITVAIGELVITLV